MSRGKTLVEIIRLSSEVPYENAVLVPEGKKIYRYNPETEWFTERVVTRGESPASEPRPVEEGALIPASGWVEVTPPSKKITVASLQEGLFQHRVPLAARKTVTAKAKVPRLPVVKQLKRQFPESKLAEEPKAPPTVKPKNATLPGPKAAPLMERKAAPAAPVTDILPEPDDEERKTLERKSLERKRADIRLPEIRVTVLPPPKTRRRKETELVEEPEPTPPSRPLKVIRRRNREEPKVFETPPKTIPQAILDGIKQESYEEGDELP